MTKTLLAAPTFHEGDEVVLALGSNQGTPGVFLQLRCDVNWADIRELNGEVRCHPVVWLAHAATAAAGSGK